MAELLQNEEVLRLLELSKNGLLFAIWETLYLTVISTFFSYVIGPAYRPASGGHYRSG